LLLGLRRQLICISRMAAFAMQSGQPDFMCGDLIRRPA
jgi:hypothetical protein